MKRRQFILSLAGTASAAGLAGWTLASSRQEGGSRIAVAKLAKFTRRSWALGADVNLTVFHNNASEANLALDAAFAEIDRVEDVLSLYRNNSQICELNRNGRLEEAHPYLIEVLERAISLSASTGGQFDVTVQPLYRLHAEKARAGTSPSPDEIRQTLKRVDWKRVQISGNSIALLGEGTEITLNGIAQGFAADAVGRVLSAHGIQHALIDTGEINTIGSHAEKDNWNIGIKHPRETNAFLGLAGLHGRCMATSGDYETRFGEGYASHHLLDPLTGYSPTELSSVSVVASTAMEADALSTALFLLGEEQGLKLIEQMEGVDALFVTKSGKTSRSAGFPLNS